MKSITTKSDSSQPVAETAVYLFDDWFDPIEAAVPRLYPGHDRGRAGREAAAAAVRAPAGVVEQRRGWRDRGQRASARPSITIADRDLWADRARGASRPPGRRGRDDQ